MGERRGVTGRGVIAAVGDAATTRIPDPRGVPTRGDQRTGARARARSAIRDRTGPRTHQTVGLLLREHLLDDLVEFAGLRIRGVGRGGRVSVAPARGSRRGDDDAGGRARLFKAENGVGARPTCAASSFRASISAMIFASSTSPFFSILSSPMSGVRDVRPRGARSDLRRTAGLNRARRRTRRH